MSPFRITRPPCVQAATLAALGLTFSPNMSLNGSESHTGNAEQPVYAQVEAGVESETEEDMDLTKNLGAVVEVHGQVSEEVCANRALRVCLCDVLKELGCLNFVTA